MSSAQRVVRTGQFHTRVDSAKSLSPRMRRITLTGPGIAAQSWPLACDIAVVLSGGDGREVRRRYTVRAVEGSVLTIDAVLHGHGPGSAWAATAAPGDEVVFFGPRGEIALPSASWLLALTDESGLPAIAAIAERLDRPIRVLAEVADPSENYPLPAAAQVTWLARRGEPAGGTAVLGAALAHVPVPDAVTTTRYAYVLSESRAVVTLRDTLSRFGLGRDDVYAKGYWNLNSRNTR